MAAIWHGKPTVEHLNAMAKGTVHEGLDIRFTEIGDDYVQATMPVDSRHHQPYGILHGGVSVVLAESLGSVGAALTVDPEKYGCVGLEVNANHLRPVRSGTVTGTATPVHTGRKVQVWSIRIEDEDGRLVCVSRLTLAVVGRDAV